MSKCPFCSANLPDPEAVPDRCPGCGRALQGDAATGNTITRDAIKDPPSPEQQTIAAQSISVRSPPPAVDATLIIDEVLPQGLETLPEGFGDEEFPSADPGSNSPATPSAGTPGAEPPGVDLNNQTVILDEPQEAGENFQTLATTELDSPDDGDFQVQATSEARPPEETDRTIVSDEFDEFSEVPVSERTMVLGPEELEALGEDLGETRGASANIDQVLNTVWSDSIDTPVSPNMTIKCDSIELPPQRQQTLVIKSRAFNTSLLSGGDPQTAEDEQAEYELLQILGEGGMGVVYSARQTSIDRSVALKMLKPTAAHNEAQQHKFLTEAVVTGDLDHPNIVPIYDVGRNASGALFYSMKHVQGTPWLKVIRQKSLNENLEILIRVADAVSFAHARGIVHRDLKPENVMLGEFGEVLVMDWGLAYATRQFRKANRVSQSASMGGTPAYMAPEMATGPIDRIGPTSDVYLLGAILYEIITGNPPHAGKTVMECLTAAARNQIAPTEKTGELLNIAYKAMQTDSAERYPGVREFEDAIREYQSHSESIVLASLAEQDLIRARKDDSFQLYSKAVFGFEEALTLWDGNVTARSRLSEARLAYAQGALRKGDFELGLSLLDPADPAHAVVRTRLQAAHDEREMRQQRLKTAKRLLAGLLVAVFAIVTVAFFWIRAERDVAEDQRQQAVNARIDADSRRKEAETAREQEEQARQRAVKSQRTAELAQHRAEEARIEADRSRENAEIARDQAETAKQAEEYEAYVARIGLAAARIDENAFGTAVELLQQCKPELRNWEWGRLMHLCSQSSRTYNATAPVDSLAISADGKRFILGSWNNTASIWEVASGKKLVSLPHAGIYIHAVALSADGRYAATGSNDRTGFLRLWNASSGEPLRKFSGHTDAVLSVQFSRDGRKLLTSSYDHTARLWDVETGKQLQIFHGHNWWVWTAAFSPDELRVVTASQDGTAIVWDVTTGTQSPPFTGHDGPVYAAQFAPDGKRIASGGYDKRVLVWKPDDLQPVDYKKLVSGAAVAPPKYRALEGHTAAVRSVQFSKDGRLILSGGHDNSVKIWDSETDRALKTFRGHDSWVRACAFSPDGRWVLSGSHDHTVKLWSIDNYEELRVLRGRVLEGHTDAVLDALFSPDEKLIVTASRDRTAKTWDFRTGRELQTFEEGHSFLASAAVFFPDGKRLLTAAADNTVRMWDVGTGTQTLQLEHAGRSAAVTLSHDQLWVLTGGDDKTAKLWNAETGSLIRSFKGHRAEVTSVAFSPDDRTLLTGDSNGHCRLWNRDTGEELRRLEGHTRRIMSVGFLPDGARALSASGDNTVAQWDVATGREQTNLVLKHPDAVLDLAIAPDGKTALTSCADRVVRLWNIAKAEVVWQTAAASFAGMVNSVAISPDGRRALTADSESRIVQIWEMSTGREIKRPVDRGELGPFLDLRTHGLSLWSASFAPDGNGILTVGGSDARLWDAETGDERLSFSPNGVVASASFSPDGKLLVTGSWDNSARIWDVETGKAVLKLTDEHTGYVNAAAFSPDGTQVLTGSDDKTARLWDLKTGKSTRVFQGHTDRVWHVAFSTDGSRILTSSADKTARLWETATGKELLQFRGHKWGVMCAMLSEDGTRVITGSEDNTARIWSVNTGETLKTLEGHTASVNSVAFAPDGARVLTGSRDNTAKLWDARTGTEILTLKGHSQEVTAVSFSPSGRYVLTGSRDGTAIVWLTVDWRKPVAATETAKNAGPPPARP